MEVRLTGILQVYAKADDEPTPFGTVLAPGINAHYHQHIFSVRVDPMVDGLHNSVVETDVISLPYDAHSNHAGNAFMTQSTTISKARDGARDINYEGDRRWAIVNPKRRHPYSGKLAGYTITGLRGATVPLKTRDEGVVAKRAPWARKPLWVVKDVETEKGGGDETESFSKMWVEFLMKEAAQGASTPSLELPSSASSPNSPRRVPAPLASAGRRQSSFSMASGSTSSPNLQSTFAIPPQRAPSGSGERSPPP